MSSVSDLIHSSFRLIGAIAAGEVLETIELNDALISLNQMIASWNTEGASLAGRIDFDVPLNAGVNWYSIPVRPVQIVAASVAVAGVDCPLQLIDAAGWEAIAEKGTSAQTAQKLYCDYQYPSCNIYIWPTPKIAAMLEIWTLATFGPFLSLTQSVDMPPGYEAGVRYNFAVNLAPEYGRPLDPAVPALAQQFKASLAQLNAANHMKSATSSAAQSAMTDMAATAAR